MCSSSEDMVFLAHIKDVVAVTIFLYRDFYNETWIPIQKTAHSLKNWICENSWEFIRKGRTNQKKISQKYIILIVLNGTNISMNL